jgi:mercuric ion transport protein
MNKNTNAETMTLSEDSSLQKREGDNSVKEPASLASLGGLIAAFFASLCCIGPVVFSALGVGVGATGMLASTAGFLKGLVPYRPFFIVVAIVAIGTGFYLVYRKPQAGCSAESSCSDGKARSKSVVWLWMATGFTLIFLLSPYWLGIFK